MTLYDYELRQSSLQLLRNYSEVIGVFRVNNHNNFYFQSNLWCFLQEELQSKEEERKKSSSFRDIFIEYVFNFTIPVEGSYWSVLNCNNLFEVAEVDFRINYTMNIQFNNVTRQ